MAAAAASTLKLDECRSNAMSWFQNHFVVDMIPESARVVVVESKISLYQAFSCLAINDTPAAQVWDEKLSDFIGLFTIDDILLILFALHEHGPAGGTIKHQMQKMTIRDWIETHPKYKRAGRQIEVGPDDTLLDLCQVLGSYPKLRYLPVVERNPDQGAVLQIVNYTVIIRYLVFQQFHHELDGFVESFVDLGIGSFGSDLVTADESATIAHVLTLMAENSISSIPILHADGSFLDLFCSMDLLSLWSTDFNFDPNMKIQNIPSFRQRSKETAGALSCDYADSLSSLIKKFASSRSRRLVVLDHKRKVTGIVSLIDLFRFFLKLPRAPPSSLGSPLSFKKKKPEAPHRPKPAS